MALSPGKTSSSFVTCANGLAASAEPEHSVETSMWKLGWEVLSDKRALQGAGCSLRDGCAAADVWFFLSDV